MSENSEQNRSELPSQFKLERARREGNVARGSDLGFLSVMTALTGFAWFAGPSVPQAVGLGSAIGLAATDADLVGVPGYLALTARILAPVTAALLPLLAVVFAVVLVVEFLQTGPVFSGRALRFDFSRLSPAKGLKRIFSVRILIETFKGVLKLTLYSAVAGLFIAAAVTQAAAISDVGRLAGAMATMIPRLLAGMLAVAAAIALFDQLVSRRDFLKKMRMSRREVKREHRDREGDARLKQRRKELHSQFARTSQSLRGIRQADLVVVNPVHFAVGLRYQPGTMDAPIVVSRGSHAMALRLRRLAFAYNVPVVVDPVLARRLFRTSALGRPIPEDLFRPVADIYLGLRRRREEQGATIDA